MDLTEQATEVLNFLESWRKLHRIIQPQFIRALLEIVDHELKTLAEDPDAHYALSDAEVAAFFALSNSAFKHLITLDRHRDFNYKG